jgi:uridine kinase
MRLEDMYNALNSEYSYSAILEQSVPIIKQVGGHGLPVFIPISGPDATGKTTLAKKLTKELNDTVVVATDCYLNNSREERLMAAREGRSGYWLDMHYTDLLLADLRKLKASQPIKRRVYDTTSGITLEVAGEYLRPAKFIIIDSGLSLTDALWALYPPERFGIFISADKRTRRLLKSKRDKKERHYADLYEKHGSELVKLFIQRNLEDCEMIVLPTAERADLIAEIDESYAVLSLQVRREREQDGLGSSILCSDYELGSDVEEHNGR